MSSASVPQRANHLLTIVSHVAHLCPRCVATRCTDIYDLARHMRTCAVFGMPVDGPVPSLHHIPSPPRNPTPPPALHMHPVCLTYEQTVPCTLLLQASKRLPPPSNERPLRVLQQLQIEHDTIHHLAISAVSGDPVCRFSSAKPPKSTAKGGDALIANAAPQVGAILFGSEIDGFGSSRDNGARRLLIRRCTAPC